MKKLLKRLLKSNVFISFMAYLASLYLRFVYLSGQWQIDGTEHPKALLEAGKPFILCFWHGRLMMMPFCWNWKNHSIHALISDHRDGRLISKVVRHLGIKTVSGSSSKNGAEAFRQIVSLLRRGDWVGITPDGPKGPAFSVKEGVIKAAYLAKVPIVPLTFSAAKGRFMKSWDKFLLAKPFSKGVILWGAPIYIEKLAPEKLDLSACALHVNKAMQDLCDQADKRMRISNG